MLGSVTKPTKRGPKGDPAQFLLLSAASREALTKLAGDYADRIDSSDADRADIVGATALRANGARIGLAMDAEEPAALGAALQSFARGERGAAEYGAALPAKPSLAFVFSGNGAQWPGMGRAAYKTNRGFRSSFETVDRIFAPLAGWSLVAALDDPKLETRLGAASVSQPLLFAVQVGVTTTLRNFGFSPDFVIGHSVGEIAAAWACGALDLETATRLVHGRSLCQEPLRGFGGMAVAACDETRLREFSEEFDLRLEVAAVNSSASITVSGDNAQMEALVARARRARIAVRRLAIDYPFHSSLMEPVRAPLRDALKDIRPKQFEGACFVSTVTGGVLGGEALNADYWWRNLRDVVRFRDAVAYAARAGASIFMEIGPQPILLSPISDTLRECQSKAAAVPSLAENEAATDQIAACIASLLAHGAVGDEKLLFGARPKGRVSLPPLPRNPKLFKAAATSQALGLFLRPKLHPLLGSRLQQGTPEWRNLLDASVLPYLADHRVDGEVVLPGAALAEMALAVAREIFPEGAIGLTDFDLIQWMSFDGEVMREISTRYDGAQHVVEIWSRQRLGPDEWSLHARGRIASCAEPPAFPCIDMVSMQELESAQVYAAASAGGLDYGPSFRRVARCRADERIVESDFAPVAPDEGSFSGAYTLHPTVLDAAFHGIFPQIKRKRGRKTAYVPTRFTDLRVYRDNAEVHRAVMVKDSDAEHALTASLALYDAEGAIVATLRGGLFRSVALADHDEREALFCEKLLAVDPPAVFDARAVLTDHLARAAAQTRPDAWLLLEAFSRALAFEALSAHFGPGVLDLQASVAAGRTARAALPLIYALLHTLRDAGLAHEVETRWRLAEQSELPPARQILATLAAESPDANFELVLSAFVLATLGDFLRDGVVTPTRRDLAEKFDRRSMHCQPALRLFADVCEDLAQRLAPEPLRVLVAEPNHAGVLRALHELTDAGRAVVVIACQDIKRQQHAAAKLGARANVDYLVTSDEPATGAPFHLALALGLSPVVAEDQQLIKGLSRRLVARGALAVWAPERESAFDLFWGMSDNWFDPSSPPDFPLVLSPGPTQIERALKRADCQDVATIALGEGLGAVVVANPTVAPGQPALPPLALFDPAKDVWTQAFTAALSEIGAGCVGVDDEDPASAEPVVAFLATRKGAGTAADLTGAIDRFAALLRRSPPKRRILVLTRGLAQGGPEADWAEAFVGFARVAANEYPELALETVDFAPEFDAAAAAERLAEYLREPRGETQTAFEAAGRRVLRILPRHGAAGAETAAENSELEFAHLGALSRAHWSPRERQEPGPGEVEIEVAATGLNFRDVMWSLGLLSDDVLEGGLAGPSMGFECAGRVVRVGKDVARLKVGDRVMGFARRSFANYVVAAEDVFVVVPEAFSTEAAATIPVAFLTAWYALFELARVRPGEWVLIHGAAGGVGLAALQVANALGARVAATAGAPDKRALATFFGAEKVYDSRSTRFADQIRAEIGGVDVVLNSLSGEAMRAGIGCLKPFGRFVELGKRDYVANTALHLRPFRRNLGYFGVDIDQLLARDISYAGRMMDEIGKRFADGAFSALPYVTFDALEAERAFRFMQSAGHVGKILIRPPTAGTIRRKTKPQFTPAPGAHLVIGGVDGFGFETALWLAEKGAQTVVVASRRGRLSPEHERRVEPLRARGVQFVVDKVDVSRADEVNALIARIGVIAPLKGVIHCAMTLEDSAIANMTEAQLTSVLSPKVDGALCLDAATRGAALDYFVVYSSATALIGNPGQGAYVAANGFLQGLMRRRRKLGLPGLAVGWGAIADAGVLTRSGDTVKHLARLTGVLAMPAADALARLEELLANNNTDPVVYCAALRPTKANRRLKTAASPSFASLLGAAQNDLPEEVDVREMLAGKSPAEAQALITTLVAAEIAQILHVSADEIDPGRPLSDLGMDSLMGLELRMNLETRLGVDLPLVAITSVKTLADLGARVGALLHCQSEPGDAETLTARDLAARHMDENADAPTGLANLHAGAVAEVMAAGARNAGGLT